MAPDSIADLDQRFTLPNQLQSAGKEFLQARVAGVAYRGLENLWWRSMPFNEANKVLVLGYYDRPNITSPGEDLMILRISQPEPTC